MDDLERIRTLVQGALSLCCAGAPHEIERDEELCEAMDQLADVSTTPEGVVCTTESGRRFAVTVVEVE